jgi:hypothetical protein
MKVVFPSIPKCGKGNSLVAVDITCLPHPFDLTCSLGRNLCAH